MKGRQNFGIPEDFTFVLIDFLVSKTTSIAISDQLCVKDKLYAYGTACRVSFQAALCHNYDLIILYPVCAIGKCQIILFWKCWYIILILRMWSASFTLVLLSKIE